MPTLVERIQELSNRIRSLADSQVTEDEAKGFATRRQELTDLFDAIRVPARRVELLRSKGIHIETPSAEATALKRRIDELAARYESDPLSILEPDANWRYGTRNQLSKLATNVVPGLSDGWRSYVLKLKPIVDQGLLRVLESTPAHAAHANMVEDLDDELGRLADSLPTTQEEIDRPQQLSERLNRLLEDLPTDIPQPVRELFNAINQGTATAAQLTEEAVNWLRDSGLLDTLEVSWRSS